MKNLIKQFLLLFTLIVAIIISFKYLEYEKISTIELQKNILIKQARTHFKDHQNTRKWIAHYGGVYVKPLNGLEPNPYLMDNTLKVDENLTLIKINPAWMTRQLSELSKTDSFSFNISSLTPLNPENITTAFEKEALKYFTDTKSLEYYKLEKYQDKFNYMGALKTTKSCLPCHAHQGYVLGDIKGGISIALDSSEYNNVVSYTKDRTRTLKLLSIAFFISIALLVYNQLVDSQELQTKVYARTKEIQSTQFLLQKIIDIDMSFVVLMDGLDIVYANKTILEFTNSSNIEELKQKNKNFSMLFENLDEDPSFLQAEYKDTNWLQYLKDNQDEIDLKVLIKKDGKKRYFKPYAKDLTTSNHNQYLIKFDEITNEYKKIQDLEKKASIDSLTKLFNRRKIDDVLEKEMDLAHAVLAPLSIVFIDIDHFKSVNDTYGHDVGDKVLVELAHIITSTVRSGDYAARWGGEEFLVTLLSTNLSQAIVLSEKLRKKVEEFNFTTVGKLTISIGVTEYIDNEDEKSFIKRADTALYEAKGTGRNKIVSS